MPLLRTCSGALATALAAGNIPYSADLITIILPGVATYNWTIWPTDLVYLGTTYASGTPAGGVPWLSRGRLSVPNTMVVPTLAINILASTASFGGGGAPGLLTQIHNGLLDGGTLSLQRVFMPTDGDTSTYGAILLFFGDIGAVSLKGQSATLNVRGKNSRLAVNAPRNVYQPSCLHTFCDPGCTLNAASFTNSYTILGGSTRSRINVVSGPTSPQLVSGTFTVTSGAALGNAPRNIIAWDGFSQITLAYPLSVAPSVGDTATIFLACDKTVPTCSGVFGNLVNIRAFPFIPPPATNAPGQ